MNQLNTIAKLSYLNCCSGGRFITCRQGRGDCTNTSRYGSWDDGCLPYKDSSINNLKDYDDVYALKQACINTMQEITDKINDFNEKLNSKMDEMKIILNQSISDNEKYTKSLIEKLNLDQLRRDFNLVKQSLMTKLEKKDLNDLYLKHDELKTSLLALKEQFDQLKTNGDVLSEANTKILKQIEYLNGLIATIKVNSNNSAKSNDTSNIDLSKYATYTDLNNAIKNSQNETKKINAEIEEIKSALLKLTSNLRYFASENDMKNMEQL